MKKSLVLFISLVTFFFILPVTTSSISAKVITMQTGTASIGKDEVVDDDLFIGAENVEIEGTVNGNVYAGAQTVRINGVINGSLHTGASIIYLGGVVSENVYIGAGNVTLNEAKIGNSLHIGAGNVNIDKSSSIGGSLIVGGGTIAIYSPVKRNVIIGGGSVDLNTEVGGEVRIGAGDITIGPNTKIAKDLYYVIDQNESDIKISESASVSGITKRVENNIANKNIETARKDVSKGLKTLGLFANIVSLLGSILVGLLWLRLYPKSFTKPSNFVTASLWKSLGIGFLASILVFPLLLILAVTMIGLPLAGLSLLFLVISFYLSKLVVGLSLGEWLATKLGQKKISVFLTFILGIVSIYLLKAVPKVGFLVSLLVFWEGFGALLLYYKDQISAK